jgi:hypothetical protein
MRMNTSVCVQDQEARHGLEIPVTLISPKAREFGTILGILLFIHYIFSYLITS